MPLRVTAALPRHQQRRSSGANLSPGFVEENKQALNNNPAAKKRTHLEVLSILKMV
jgi:hypothetical protein